MERIILETHITNLIQGRRVRWLSDQGEWIGKRETRVFQGAYPTMCRDEAAARDCEEEWRKGRVKLTIRTNLRVKKESTPDEVDRAEKFVRKEGRDQETAEKIAGEKKERERSADIEKKQEEIARKKREEYESRREATEKRQADSLSDSEKMKPIAPLEEDDVPIHPIPENERDSRETNPFQARPLK